MCLFRDWNVKDWFGGKDDRLYTDGGVIDDKGNELESGTVYKMPSALRFSTTTAMSSTASTGVTLSANVEPLDASNQFVDWSIKWTDKNSAFANGKTVTDYVTITAKSAGSKTADLNCLQAFGEQIKIDVTSMDNPDIKAECAVDYYKRLEDINLTWSTTSVDSTKDNRIGFTYQADYSTYVKPVVELVLGVGTVADTYTVSDLIDLQYSLEYFEFLECSPMWQGNHRYTIPEKSVNVKTGFIPNTKFLSDMLIYSYDTYTIPVFPSDGSLSGNYTSQAIASFGSTWDEYYRFVSWSSNAELKKTAWNKANTAGILKAEIMITTSFGVQSFTIMLISNVLLVISYFVTIAVPIFLLFKIVFDRYLKNENNDYNQDSKPYFNAVLICHASFKIQLMNIHGE